MGRVEMHYAVEPSDWYMRVPDAMKRCAVFLGLNKEPGNNASGKMVGTGFIVHVEEAGEAFNYLVTAKHVMEDWLLKYPDNDPFARMNNREGKAYRVSLRGVKWYTHESDFTADVALCEIPPQGQGLVVVPPETFVKDKHFDPYHIGIGDEIYTVGVLSFATHVDVNEPVLRYGTIAMLPPYPIKTKVGMMDLQLVEMRSLGCVSGSPVFVRETVWQDAQNAVLPDGTRKLVRTFAPGRSFLLGLMRGHWDVDPSALNEMEPTGFATNGVNMGIGMVVPAHKIEEILYSQELKERRRVSVERKKEQSPETGPREVLDSAVVDEFTRDDFMDALKKVARRPSEDDVSAESGPARSPKKSGHKKP